jgi:hypothetical protein
LIKRVCRPEPARDITGTNLTGRRNSGVAAEGKDPRTSYWGKPPCFMLSRKTSTQTKRPSSNLASFFSPADRSACPFRLYGIRCPRTSGETNTQNTKDLSVNRLRVKSPFHKGGFRGILPWLARRNPPLPPFRKGGDSFVDRSQVRCGLHFVSAISIVASMVYRWNGL